VALAWGCAGAGRGLERSDAREDPPAGLALYLAAGALAIATVGQQSTASTRTGCSTSSPATAIFFFWAAYSNDLDYAAYYPTLPLDEAYAAPAGW